MYITIGETMEFTVDLPQLQNAKSINANDFGMNEELEDNTTALNEAIDYCRQFDSSILEINQGIYKFNSTETINLNGMNEFCMDAKGSEFIFSTPSHFRLKGCNRTLLKNLVVDWDWEKDRLASLVRVHSISKEDGSIEFEFLELETVATDVRFFNMNQYDSKTFTPGTENGQEFWQERLLFHKIEKGGKANHLRIFPKEGSFCNLSEGEVFLVRHSPRRGAALVADDCSHVTLINLTIFSSPGACFVISGETHHVRLDSCVIGLRPDSNRHQSTDADGYHIVQSQGYHIIENCDFSYMGDDDVNIHDCIGFVSKRSDSFSIRLENAISGKPGDVLEVRGPDFSDTGIRLEIVENTSEKDKLMVFKNEIPETVGETFMLRNTRFNSSNYIIRNNHFHHNRARGLLLQCSNGLVENNRFTGTQGAAIYVMMETLRNLWYEGVGVEHLVIRNNIFENCNVNDWTSVIDIMAYIPDMQSDYPVFSDITIENNQFNEFPSSVIYVNKAKNIKIINNHLKSFISRKINKNNRGHFYVNHSNDVLIENNVFEPSVYITSPGYVHTDGKSDGGSYRLLCDSLM